jgi:hypothetical protein
MGTNIPIVAIISGGNIDAMLYSTEKCVTGKRPVFAAWFGNFFEPYFSDQVAVERGLRDLQELGMNSVVLDSKLWSDFTRFFQTGEQSQYVAMQNFIREQCAKHGLGLSFLALFAIGDNLYPDIYDHPPEFVEQPVDFWGKPFRGYRHWSNQQLAAHVGHTLNLYRHIAKDSAAQAVDADGAERLPFYFYHSPVFAPSFDADGRRHYLDWLKQQYTIDELNIRYGVNFKSIDDLQPADYWVHPDASEEVCRHVPDEADYAANNQVLLKYADNQRFKHQVMRDYFRKLLGELRRREPRFYFYAGLSQWKYFFNDFIHIQNRGWDLWDMGQLFDSPTFITMPVDTNGDVEPYIVPTELAMLRSAASDRDFVAALFIGRYIYNDLYAVCSPAEILASVFGAGGTDLYFYGYNGLDDGGNFGKWLPEQKASLKHGLDWFAAVREIAGRRIKTKDAAILFPLASYNLSAHDTDRQRYAAFRQDLLGWNKQLADNGINPDILHPMQIKAGSLDGYKILIIPSDPLYRFMRDEELESRLREFVTNGGVLLHSPLSAAHNAFQLTAQPHEADSIQWEGKIITPSPVFISYADGEPHATYIGNGAIAYAVQQIGRGQLHSFGFDYGYGYTAREHLPVPRKYKKEAHYPLTIINRSPVEKLLAELHLGQDRKRGVETIPFANGTLTINHTPYTVNTPATGKHHSTFASFDGTRLPGHHAVFLTHDR